MLTRKISPNMKWLFMVALMLTLLISFTSCSDDLVGVRFEPDNNDEDGDSDKEKEGNSNISQNQIFEDTCEPGTFVLYV